MPSGSVAFLLGDWNIGIKNNISLVKRQVPVLSGGIGNDVARRTAGLLFDDWFNSGIISLILLIHMLYESLIVRAFTHD